jgi:pimeloyl-ACP methyl ester carboxylesterase
MVARAFYQQMKWATDDDWLGLLVTPVLIIHGKDDGLISLDNALKLYEELETMRLKVGITTNSSQGKVLDASYCSFKIVENSGHFPMLEQPDVVNSFIEDFLNDRLL